jgi:hypothetical protein
MRQASIHILDGVEDKTLGKALGPGSHGLITLCTTLPPESTDPDAQTTAVKNSTFESHPLSRWPIRGQSYRHTEHTQ